MRIREVSNKFNIPITTLRYFEKAGLFDDVKRVNGIREYDDNDVERLSMIITLKNMGMDIETILNYIELTKKGAATIKERIIILKNERCRLLDEIHAYQKNLDCLDYLLYKLKK